MAQYINKSAVVAEINRVLNSYEPNEITSGRYALVNLRDFLDTLEVKEVASNDAFIEKAEEFLWAHIPGTDYHVNYIMKSFEKYMKGE